MKYISFMSNYRQFCVTCPCGKLTSRNYAAKNGGKCKACVTGVAPAIAPAPAAKTNYRDLCPTCGDRTLTAYQKRHGYHCDACTREAEGPFGPVGGMDEHAGRNDYQGDY